LDELDVSDKLPLVEFYQDLPKYYPFLSAECCESWKKFKSETLEAIFAKSNLPWGMPKLLSAAMLYNSQPEYYSQC